MKGRMSIPSCWAAGLWPALGLGGAPVGFGFAMALVVVALGKLS